MNAFSLVVNPMNIALVVVFGLVMGSFLNVWIYRLPLGLSPAKGRSFCPACHTQLTWVDNIPLVSFMLLVGRCRSCKVPIPARYPVVETLSALLALATFLHSSTVLAFFLYFLFLICPLVVITFIDIDTLTIPDLLTLPGIVAGVVVPIVVNPSAWRHQLLQSVLGLLVGVGVLLGLAWYALKVRKKEGMGGGDIKLAAMLGAYFGPHGVMMIFLYASLLGLVIGGLTLKVKRAGKDTAIPFGPFLALGALLEFFLHDELQALLVRINP